MYISFVYTNTKFTVFRLNHVYSIIQIVVFGSLEMKNILSTIVGEVVRADWYS